MKFIHISDLHLGKRINGFSMLEDQEYILTKIINIIDEEQPDGILIAGDVYDKPVPSEEAMQLWDRFLVKLARRDLHVFAISGNHDSAVRFSDHTILVENSGIHLSPVYNGAIKPFTLEDEYGRVNLFMLPFVKPVMVRSVFPEEEIEDYTDACRIAIQHMDVEPEERNVILAHQFVTGATRSESEDIVVGGLDQVDADVFAQFDYVALGHIHGQQHIGRETVRYCGTPLKYSFSEKTHEKSVTIVEMYDKGNTTIRTVPLVPMRDMREIRGTYETLAAKKSYEGTNTEDYIHAILTDEDDVLDATARLRLIYPNLMKVSYDNTRTRENRYISDDVNLNAKSPMELFEDFFEMQNNQPMSEEQKQMTQDLITAIWGG